MAPNRHCPLCLENPHSRGLTYIQDTDDFNLGKLALEAYAMASGGNIWVHGHLASLDSGNRFQLRLLGSDA
jgi:hypothetical protein